MTFKIGDKVKLYVTDSVEETVGTVKFVDSCIPRLYAVSFPGHSGCYCADDYTRHCPDGDGFWLTDDELELVEENQLTSIKYFMPNIEFDKSQIEDALRLPMIDLDSLIFQSHDGHSFGATLLRTLFNVFMSVYNASAYCGPHPDRLEALHNRVIAAAERHSTTPQTKAHLLQLADTLDTNSDDKPRSRDHDLRMPRPDDDASALAAFTVLRDGLLGLGVELPQKFLESSEDQPDGSAKASFLKEWQGPSTVGGKGGKLGIE